MLRTLPRRAEEPEKKAEKGPSEEYLESRRAVF